MPKVLVCASTLIHITNFHLPYLKFFKERGYEVHIAAPQTERVPYADVMHQIPMAKRLASAANLGAIWKLRRVVRDSGMDLVMTHAALAGFIGRAAVLLAGRKRTRVIHTSHGYFFWKGCGLLRKVLYYSPERVLRSVTDCVVTMNGEDYAAAARLVRKNGLSVKVPGMGVNAGRFAPASEEEKSAARRRLSIPDDALVLVYAAEFSKRKNHGELLRAMAEVVKTEPGALLLLCGSGKLQSEVKSLAEALQISESVRFLGWRSRMEEIFPACDLAVSTSTCEGLPFNIIEAQLVALPVVASRIRGHTDLIEDGANGLLYPPGDFTELARRTVGVLQSQDRGRSLGLAARQSALSYTLDQAYEANTRAYLEVMK